MMSEMSLVSLAPFRGRGKSRAAAKGEGGVWCWTARSPGLAPLGLLLPLEGTRGGSIEVSAEREQDCASDPLGVCHDLVVRNTHYAPAVVLEERGSTCVVSPRRIATMRLPVEFDNEAQRTSGEIRQERRSHRLAHELDPTEPLAADDVPQSSLGRRQVGAVFLRSRSQCFVALDQAFPLSPTPLPRKGARDFIADTYA
jgi:hypothetical protein